MLINMIKGSDERPHWDVVGCFVSADPRNRVLASWTKIERTTTRGPIMVPSRLTNFPSRFHESHSLRVTWSYALHFAWGLKVHNRQVSVVVVAGGCGLWGNPPRLTSLRTDFGTWPVTAEQSLARDSWSRRQQGKGRGQPLSASFPRKRANVLALRIGWHVWVKLCTPAGLNLFEKPCPRLRTTWEWILWS